MLCEIPERKLDPPDNGDAEESDDIDNRGRPINGSEQTRIMGLGVKYAMPLAE